MKKGFELEKTALLSMKGHEIPIQQELTLSNNFIINQGFKLIKESEIEYSTLQIAPILFSKLNNNNTSVALGFLET